jgi:hypothetical protein
MMYICIKKHVQRYKYTYTYIYKCLHSFEYIPLTGSILNLPRSNTKVALENSNVEIYIYTYLYVYLYTNIEKYMFIRTCINKYLYTYICMYKHTYINIYTFISFYDSNAKVAPENSGLALGKIKLAIACINHAFKANFIYFNKLLSEFYSHLVN